MFSEDQPVTAADIDPPPATDPPPPADPPPDPNTTKFEGGATDAPTTARQTTERSFGAAGDEPPPADPPPDRPTLAGDRPREPEAKADELTPDPTAAEGEEVAVFSNEWDGPRPGKILHVWDSMIVNVELDLDPARDQRLIKLNSGSEKAARSSVRLLRRGEAPPPRVGESYLHAVWPCNLTEDLVA